MASLLVLPAPCREPWLLDNVDRNGPQSGGMILAGGAQRTPSSNGDHAGMSRTDRAPAVELVVLAENQAPTLERAVRRLHDLLRVTLSTPWRLVVVDLASLDSTGAAAARLARELEAVEAVTVGERLDPRALRARWSHSPATMTAFLTLTPGLDLDAAVAPLVRHATLRVVPAVGARRVSRRTALATAGGLGLGVLLAACSRGSGDATRPTTSAPSAPGSTSADMTTAPASTSGSSTATPASTAGATTTVPVTLAPESTEGPYYLDLDLVRADIVEDREGAPLALELTVIDVGSGRPVEGAAVDVWHCDANGLYSGFVEQSASSNRDATDLSDSGTFLRGTLLTDAGGTARFTTIYPGWYQGRTVHIHVKVHAAGRTVHTGQLYFDDTVTDDVLGGHAPYSSRSERTTRNDDDGIYGRGGGSQTTLAVTPSAAGYLGTLTMGVGAS
jgi:protocatechuate 3,4-dioxygenase beta subunit